MAVVWVTPEDVTPSGTTGWQIVDTATVPDGASGVIVQCINADSGGSRFVGLRKEVSTDDRFDRFHNKGHTYGFCGVDSTGRFNAYRNNTNVSYWLVAYFQAEAKFFTNATDKEPTPDASWEPVDVTTERATLGSTVAKVALWEWTGDDFGPVNVRKKGSTDSRLSDNRNHSWNLSEVDSDEVCEWNKDTGTTGIFFVGYMTDAITMPANATERTADLSAGNWVDLTALPAGAEGGIHHFFDFEAHGSDEFCGVRENGNTRDTTAKWCSGRDFTMLIAKADGSQIVEAWAATGHDGTCWEMGNFEADSAGGIVARNPALRQPLIRF